MSLYSPDTRNMSSRMISPLQAYHYSTTLLLCSLPHTETPTGYGHIRGDPLPQSNHHSPLSLVDEAATAWEPHRRYRPQFRDRNIQHALPLPAPVTRPNKLIRNPG
ncbi:hypothetical protein AURDEDRAFT_170212 [Auricularia subglabra TFB-10046 SS5]|nr:hypothetical protein AURDEDRAFT_170212 [Auricularia subglabra TFB-10046 SS5]